MNEYNENELNAENELSLEKSMKASASMPDVNLEDIEETSLDTETIGTFKIDDNMPEELKQQLIRLNQKTERLNSIVSEMAQDTDSYKDLETAEYYDDSSSEQDSSDEVDAIEENDDMSDSDVDSLF